MIWVAWRQQRLQILVSAGVVIVAAVVIVAVHWAIARDLAPTGQSDCWNTVDGCWGERINQIARRFYQARAPWVGRILPALLGMFVGGPMFAREFEAGTHIFGLTQSISRTRWWITKAIVGATPAVLCMTGLGVLNAWAFQQLPGTEARLTSPYFESQGLVLGAYTLLSVAFGIAAGLLVRNTVGAMAVTLVLYVGVVAAFAVSGIRANVIPPVVSSWPIEQTTIGAPVNSWELHFGWADDDGQEVPVSAVPDNCTGDSPNAYTACLRQHGVVAQFIRYQPDRRFWPLQFIEAGIMTLTSLIALALGALALRRRAL